MIGLLFVFLGGFVAAINLVTMFPNPNYSASWRTVSIAIIYVVVGVILNKRNKQNP